MDAVRYANLALSFLLELGLLGAFAYWGFVTGGNTLMKYVLGIGAPLLAAVFWGAFLAPKAAVSLPKGANLALKVVVFALGAAALYAARRPTLAWVFAAAVAINLLLALLLGQ